jgi:hypothetical protein
MLSRTTCHGGGMDAADCTAAKDQTIPAAAASPIVPPPAICHRSPAAEGPHERQHRCCLLLFFPADAWNLAGWNIGIEPPAAVSQHAVGHLDAVVRPTGDRSTCPELSVVRVRHDHKNPLDIAVRDHGNRPPPGSGQPICGTVPVRSDMAGHVVGAVNPEDHGSLAFPERPLSG